MDERERRAANVQRARQQNAQRRRTSGSDARTGTPRTAGAGPNGPRQGSTNGRGQNPRKRSSRARRRRRNLIIRTILLIVLIIIVIGGLIVWKKYGSSKEKADLKQYYGIQNDDDLATVVNNQVIGGLEGGTAGGKVFDGVPYIEYSVVRDYINERFYWDSNENVLLYTLPNGSVSVSVGSKEYTNIKEKKSEDYVILKAEGKTAYIALAFIQEYTNMDYKIYESKDNAVPERAVIECDWGEHS